MDGFGFGLIFGAIALFLNFIFADMNFYPESFEYATSVCENNGGIDRIQEDRGRSGTAICKNGANFEYNWEKIRKN